MSLPTHDPNNHHYHAHHHHHHPHPHPHERVPYETFMRCLALMAHNPPQRAWPIDQKGQMTFFKCPEAVDLAKQSSQIGLYGGALNLSSLPPELHAIILSYLQPVDRVCLALTCKALTASATASKHLRAYPWRPWLFFADDMVPSKDLLIRRLAHGWIDKTEYRYCKTCARILSRSPDHWRAKVPKRKKLPHDVKVGMEKEKWKKLSLKKQYEWIIDKWCSSTLPDDSIFACDGCFERALAVNDSQDEDHAATRPSLTLAERQQRDLEKGNIRSGNFNEAPIECPSCVIHSLLNTFKPPHKPKVRPVLWKWTRWTVNIVGNAVLIVVYLIYLFFKLPVDLGMWLWKKYKRNRVSGRRSLWCFR